MRNVILIHNQIALVIALAADVNAVVTDILLMIEERICQLVAIGDVVISKDHNDKEAYQFRNWVNPDQTKCSSRFNARGNTVLFVEEKHDRAFLVQHLAKWRKRASGKLATIADIAPTSMQKIAEWVTAPATVKCANCGSTINGTRRTKGASAQVFRPSDPKVFNIGKRWFCACSSTTKQLPVPFPPALELTAEECFIGKSAEVKQSELREARRQISNLFALEYEKMSDREVLAFIDVIKYLKEKGGEY